MRSSTLSNWGRGCGHRHSITIGSEERTGAIAKYSCTITENVTSVLYRQTGYVEVANTSRTSSYSSAETRQPSSLSQTHPCIAQHPWRAEILLVQTHYYPCGLATCERQPYPIQPYGLLSARSLAKHLQVFFASKAALTLGKRSTFLAGASVLSHG